MWLQTGLNDQSEDNVPNSGQSRGHISSSVGIKSTSASQKRGESVSPKKWHQHTYNHKRNPNCKLWCDLNCVNMRLRTSSSCCFDCSVNRALNWQLVCGDGGLKSGVYWEGIRGYTPYTNLWCYLMAYTYLIRYNKTGYMETYALECALWSLQCRLRSALFLLEGFWGPEICLECIGGCGSAPDPAGGAHDGRLGGGHPLFKNPTPRHLWCLHPRAFGARCSAPLASGIFTTEPLGPCPHLWHTHTHNRFTALWNLSGKTRVSRYQKNIHPLLSS